MIFKGFGFVIYQSNLSDWKKIGYRPVQIAWLRASASNLKQAKALASKIEKAWVLCCHRKLFFILLNAITFKWHLAKLFLIKQHVVVFCYSYHSGYSSAGREGDRFDRYAAHNEQSTVHKLKETYWTTKQVCQTDIGPWKGGGFWDPEIPISNMARSPYWRIAPKNFRSKIPISHVIIF